MLRAFLAALTACAISLSCFPVAAVAQSDSGSIRIVVTDQQTKAPLELSRVILDGPVIASEVAGKNGQVLFTEVPDGVYRARVSHGGYQQVTSEQFEVVNGRAVVVDVQLATSSNLKVISTVTARSTATVSTSAITNDSAQRKLSNDLADALNKLSGVSVSTSSDDSDATQTISLEGHDASQTQVTLDGIPMNSPGSSFNLGGIATDLFGGASVHNGPQLGGLGGGVNFSTLQPTLSWMSQSSLSAGSNGRYNYSFGESGTLGKVGVALQHTYRLNSSLIDGMTFMDASGLDYSHNGDSTIDGNLVKLRFQANPSQTLSATFLGSDRTTQASCLRNTSGIPCGVGPDNHSSSNFQMYSVTDSALIGQTTVQASLFSTASNSLNDDLNRYVDGVAQPIGSSMHSLTDGYSVSATLPSSTRHTISISAYGTNAQQKTTPLVAQANPYYNGTASSSYGALQVTDTVHATDKLQVAESVGISRATGSNSTVLGSIGATYRATPSDTFSLSYALGGVSANMGRSTILTDPAALRFDCNGNVAYGNAPGDQPGNSSSTSARIGYTKTVKGGNIGVQLYRQVQNNVVLPVEVNGSALNLSPVYLAQIQQVYNSPAGCNTAPGTPFDATHLYFTTPIGGVQRVYEGGSLTGYMTLGNLVVQPYYNVNIAKAISNDPRIVNPYSITISGQQVPNVPMQKAGVVLDYKARGSALEFLADAQYTAKNNPNNLPAYTTFDAGVSSQLRTGTLTFAASNITNTYGGVFASPANSVPYFTANGTPIDTIARPLTPRSYSVTYSLKFGPGAMGVSQTGAPGLPGTRGRGGFGGPGASEGGPGGGQGGTGRGGMRNLLTPLPASPPDKPFDLNTASQICNAQTAQTATQMQSEIKAFVAQVEGAKTAGGYPQTMTVPAYPDLAITYHGLGSTYALTITPKNVPNPNATPRPSPSPGAQGRQGGFGGGGFGAMRALIGCFPVHTATQDDVAKRGLYAPTTTLFVAPSLVFEPSVGLYLVQRPQQTGQEQFRVYKLPATPPSTPFEVRASDSCTGDAKSIAQQNLDQLQSYFSRGVKPANWTITPHTAKGGTWYELQPVDMTAVGALVQCARVAASTSDELQQRGFDGVMIPGLNYAQPLGLYIIRPQRPQASPSPGASAPPAKP